MINKARIVPVTKSDLLTLYGTMLTMANVSYSKLAAADINGDFSVAGSGSAGTFLCAGPVKSLDIPVAVTGCTVYFVAGYSFDGLTVAGAAPTFNSSYLDNDDVIKDCATLYKAVLSSGTVTLTAVSPVAE